MEWEFNSYYTLIAATLVLLIGKVLVNKVKFLRDFNIPEPVAGGLIAAIVLFALHQAYGVSFKFEKPLQDAFMLIFFTSIGLSADFSRLKAGGLPLVIFTAVVGAFIVVQNFVGVGLAKVLGLDPLIGLITGSITLTGGHGTAGAWGPDFENKFGLVGATGLGMASATFGLVFGGLIGGPVARRLINKMGRKPIEPSARKENADEHTDDVFEQAKRTRLITAESAVETLAMFAACLAFAEIVDGYDKEYLYDLPKFVWCLFAGVVIRNILTSAFSQYVRPRHRRIRQCLPVAFPRNGTFELEIVGIDRSCRTCNHHSRRTNRRDDSVRNIRYLRLHGARLRCGGFGGRTLRLRLGCNADRRCQYAVHHTDFRSFAQSLLDCAYGRRFLCGLD